MPLMERLGAEGSPPGTKLHHFNTVLHMNTLQGPRSTISSTSHCGMVQWLRQFCFTISCQTCQQTNDYEDPFITAYYNQCGVDMVQRALLPHGSKWKTWHLTPVYMLQFAQ